MECSIISIDHSLLLEHDHRIFLQVAHINLIQHALLLHAQLAELRDHLRGQEVLVAVIGII